LRLAVKKSGLNKTIKAIFIKLIKSILNLALPGLQSSNGLISEAFLVCVALM